jgi:hypothetical protein
MCVISYAIKRIQKSTRKNMHKNNRGDFSCCPHSYQIVIVGSHDEELDSEKELPYFNIKKDGYGH